MSEQQSQVPEGPFLLSFGDVLRQVISCKIPHGLKDNEFLLLVSFVETMPRYGYRTFLGALLRHKSTHWQNATHLAQQNVSRAFLGLVKKGLILSIDGKGKQKYHALSPLFAHAIYLEDIVTFCAAKKISILPSHQSDVKDHEANSDSGDNSTSSHQSDVTHDINLMCSSHQSDVTHDINLMCSSHQPDVTCSYIEIPILPKDPSSLPSSNPVVDNVDNSGSEKHPYVLTEQEARLAQHYIDEPEKRAKSFIAKLKPLQIQRLDSFLDFLDSGPSWVLDAKGMDVMWLRWFYNEFPGLDVKAEKLIAQMAN